MSGSEDGGIWVWDVSSKQVLQRIEVAHEGCVLCVDARGELLVSCGLDGCVRVWEVERDEALNGNDGVVDEDRMEM